LYQDHQARLQQPHVKEISVRPR